MASTIPSYSEWKASGATYGGGYEYWLKDYKAGKVSWKGEKYSGTEVADTTAIPIGTTKVTNGVTYKWDGATWKPYNTTPTSPTTPSSSSQSTAGLISTYTNEVQAIYDAHSMTQEQWLAKWYSPQSDSNKAYEQYKNYTPTQNGNAQEWAKWQTLVSQYGQPQIPVASDQGTNGTTQEGATKTVNGVKMTFHNGAWVSDTTTAPTGDTITPTSGTPQTVDTTQALKDANKIIDEALKRGEIDSATAQLFKNTVAGWDWNKDVNMENVLAQFQTIKNQTIDPYFREQTDVYIKDLKSAIDFQKANRESELEIERKNAGQSIRQAKEGLEASGMTFTGQGVQELGADSAYAQKDILAINNMGRDELMAQVIKQEGLSGQNAEDVGMLSDNELKNRLKNKKTMPTQIPFGGMFYEGNVNQANRLISTGSQAAYLEKQQALGRAAENALGSNAMLQNIEGFVPAGVTQGSISQAQQEAYGNALTNLSGQQQQLDAYGNPINPLNQ